MKKLTNCANIDCENQFTPWKSTSKYCSNACYKEANGFVAEDRVCVALDCANVFSVPGHKNKKIYCSKACATKTNNFLFPKRKLEGRCLECSKAISNSLKYCSSHGYKTSQAKIRVEKWLNGEWTGGNSRRLSETVRKYLLEEAKFTCSIPGCGFNTPHPADGRTVLEINHIDGDGSNHKKENLEVLCPNHHSLTLSYRGRNIGHGRDYYYLRVAR